MQCHFRVACCDKSNIEFARNIMGFQQISYSLILFDLEYFTLFTTLPLCKHSLFTEVLANTAHMLAEGRRVGTKTKSNNKGKDVETRICQEYTVEDINHK